MNAKAKAKALPPERTLHRGSVLAAGVIVDPELTSEDEAKRRVFELALRGADVRRHGTRYVVCFHAPVRLLAHEAPGQVFTRAGELLLTAPLSEREIAAAVARGVREPTLVCVEGGSVVVTPLSALARDDLAAWLDLEPFQVVETTSLGDANVAPTRALAPVESNVRGVAGVGEMSAETASVLDWLKKPARDASTSNEASAARQRAPGAPSKFWQALTSALGAAWAAFGREPLGSGAGTRGAGPADSNAYDPRAERGPSAWTRLRAAMNAFAAKFLDMTRLSSLIMGKHAEYLSRMMNMFEENDLDEALRHAIPLSKEVEGALRMHMLRPPSARTQLAITHAASQTTAALSLGDDLFSLLRAKYRRAFEQLVARGEIDKAAFVLAELLNEDEEAVAFLEKHRLWKRAAELAEARRLAPAIVVRQWFLAGDRARAIRIARATGAFADAVVRLERSHPQEAQALRIL